MYRAFEPKSPAWKNKNELPNQIKKLRTYPQVEGSIYFSSKTFDKNPNGWNDSLQNNYYHYPALVPAMPWISNAKPGRPMVAYDSATVNSFADSIKISIRQDSFSAEVNKYVMYSFPDSSQISIGDPKNIVTIVSSEQGSFVYPLINIPDSQTKIILAATCVTKSGIESDVSGYIYLEKKESKWIVTGISDIK